MKLVQFQHAVKRSRLRWPLGKWETLPDARCPNCDKSLTYYPEIVVASRDCPHCGGRVLEDDEPTDASFDDEAELPAVDEFQNAAWLVLKAKLHPALCCHNCRALSVLHWSLVTCTRSCPNCGKKCLRDNPVTVTSPQPFVTIEQYRDYKQYRDQFWWFYSVAFWIMSATTCFVLHSQISTDTWQEIGRMLQPILSIRDVARFAVTALHVFCFVLVLYFGLVLRIGIQLALRRRPRIRCPHCHKVPHYSCHVLASKHCDRCGGQMIVDPSEPDPCR